MGAISPSLFQDPNVAEPVAPAIAVGSDCLEAITDLSRSPFDVFAIGESDHRSAKMRVAVCNAPRGSANDARHTREATEKRINSNKSGKALTRRLRVTCC